MPEETSNTPPLYKTEPFLPLAGESRSNLEYFLGYLGNHPIPPETRERLLYDRLLLSNGKTEGRAELLVLDMVLGHSGIMFIPKEVQTPQGSRKPLGATFISRLPHQAEDLFREEVISPAVAQRVRYQLQKIHPEELKDLYPAHSELENSRPEGMDWSHFSKPIIDYLDQLEQARAALQQEDRKDDRRLREILKLLTI